MNKISKQGVLGSLNKNILTVASEYQRAASKKLVKDITRDWNWLAAGVIAVSKRDNVHYVIDGQHRVLAAQEIPEITHLPCIIFEGLSIKQEAAALAEINTKRKSMSQIDRFNAAVVSGDELAMWVKNRLESYKIMIAKRGMRTVSGVKMLLNVAAEDKSRFNRVLDICAKLFKNAEISSMIFAGLAMIDKKESIAGDFKDRILFVGAEKLITTAKSATIAAGNKNARIYARGIVDAVNRGLRNKFEVEL